MIKIEAPKLLRKIEEKHVNDFVNEEKIIEGKFLEEKLSDKIKGIEINGCVFKNVDFSGGMLEDADLIDCVFD